MTRTLTDQQIHTWAQLLLTSKTLLEQVECALKQAQLPPLAWYDVLLEVYRANDSGLRQFEIAQRILLSKYNLSRLLDKLEAKHLIARCHSPEDGRSNSVTITAEGTALLTKMWPIYAQIIEQHFAAKLNPDEIASLSVILDKLRKD